MTTQENTLYHGYEWPRQDKVCIDCGAPHVSTITLVCEICNEIRRKIDDELEIDQIADARMCNRFGCSL